MSADNNAFALIEVEKTILLRSVVVQIIHYYTDLNPNPSTNRAISLSSLKIRAERKRKGGGNKQQVVE